MVFPATPCQSAERQFTAATFRCPGMRFCEKRQPLSVQNEKKEKLLSTLVTLYPSAFLSAISLQSAFIACKPDCSLNIFHSTNVTPLIVGPIHHVALLLLITPSQSRIAPLMSWVDRNFPIGSGSGALVAVAPVAPAGPTMLSPLHAYRVSCTSPSSSQNARSRRAHWCRPCRPNHRRKRIDVYLDAALRGASGSCRQEADWRLEEG